MEAEKRRIVYNLCNLSHRDQARFMQMCSNAVKSGIDTVRFIKAWNHYAKNITEHVFWTIN